MSISKIVGWWPQAMIYGLMFLSAAVGSRYDARLRVNAQIEQRRSYRPSQSAKARALNYCNCSTADTQNIVNR
jgi:hypothetical protein